MGLRLVGRARTARASRSVRSRTSASGRWRRRRPWASSSYTVWAMNWCSGFWKTKPIAGRQRAGASMRPASTADPHGAARRRHDPGDRLDQRRLACAVRTDDRDELPGVESRSMPCSTRVRARSRVSPRTVMSGRLPGARLAGSSVALEPGTPVLGVGRGPRSSPAGGSSASSAARSSSGVSGSGSSVNPARAGAAPRGGRSEARRRGRAAHRRDVAGRGRSVRRRRAGLMVEDHDPVDQARQRRRGCARRAGWLDRPPTTRSASAA